MSPLWQSEEPPDPVRVGPIGIVLVVLRGVPLAFVVFGGLAVHLSLRLVEYPVFGLHRPWTPSVTRMVCRMALRILGLSYTLNGEIMSHHGMLVSNHVSWLDIFTLNAAKRIYFVSKAEVAGWPGIGWLARATGTVFIERDRRQARAHTAQLQDRLDAGHRLLFFPEGTSTDGLRVLPFRTTLFAACFEADAEADLWVQPVTLVYRAPAGAPARFYGWWGDMDFGEGLLKILAQRPQGGVEIAYHPPLRVADFKDRKALARTAEAAVRGGLDHGPA